MIEFVNAVSMPFVTLVFVILGAPTIWLITLTIKRGSDKARILAHQEKMAQIKSEDPKLIEGRAQR